MRLRVPQVRGNPRSGAIDLAFVRLRSDRPGEGPPIVYLAGGPGQSAIPAARSPYALPFLTRLASHGDIILRGEIDAAVRENTNYLNNIKKAVKSAGKRKNVDEYLETINIEDCGKSRVHLGGLAVTLHERNLRALYRQMHGE